MVRTSRGTVDRRRVFSPFNAYVVPVETVRLLRDFDETIHVSHVKMRYASLVEIYPSLRSTPSFHKDCITIVKNFKMSEIHFLYQRHQLLSISTVMVSGTSADLTLLYFENGLQAMFMPTLALQRARALRSSFAVHRTMDGLDRKGEVS